MSETRIEDLRRRVEADPTSVAFAALAEEYRRVGRFQEAVDVCRRGLERHPAYLSARVTLGRSLMELQELDAAKQELEHVLRLAPENLAAIRGLAEIHHRRAEAPESLETYPPAAATPPLPQPVAVTPASDPALVRLEHFLTAIVSERQRRERAVV
jgi:tetratricopeptide (TPR) repeat protein